MNDPFDEIDNRVDAMLVTLPLEVPTTMMLTVVGELLETRKLAREAHFVIGGMLGVMAAMGAPAGAMDEVKDLHARLYETLSQNLAERLGLRDMPTEGNA